MFVASFVALQRSGGWPAMVVVCFFVKTEFEKGSRWQLKLSSCT